MNIDLKERFWSKVDIKKKNDCWNWTASQRGNGYGCIRIGNKILDSHRVAWILTYGEILDGLWVLHKSKCHNRLCCNPNHLYLGTRFDNAKDSVNDGTCSFIGNKIPRPYGEKASAAKLTWEKVKEIREKLSLGTTLIALSKEYNVDERNIAQIRDNKIWKI